MKISPPQYTFFKKVRAILGAIPDVTIPENLDKDSDGSYVIHIEVTNHLKFLALKGLLPEEVNFGGIIVKVMIYDKANEQGFSPELIKALFADCPLVKDVISRPVFPGSPDTQYFVRFDPKNSLIQFGNNDASDFNGNFNGLAQDVAREIFSQIPSTTLSFCTADKRESN